MEHKELSGAIFTNDRKQNDRQPDFNGSAMINGQLYRISAWKRQGQCVAEWWSLAFELTRDQMPAGARPAPTYAQQSRQSQPVLPQQHGWTPPAEPTPNPEIFGNMDEELPF